MTVKPGEYDLTIYRGAALKEQFQFFKADGVTPFALTGYTVQMQARETYDATTAYVDLSTANGGIEITDGAQGKLTLKMDASDTAAITILNGVYDLKMSPGGDNEQAIRVLFGAVRASREVTR